MKKIILLVILLILIPIKVYAENCDGNKIVIKSITIEENNNVIENTPAYINGKNLAIDLKMSEVGNNIKYKINVNNGSEEDYMFEKNDLNISSEYIDYSLESIDKSNIIKAKTSKQFYINIQYKEEIPSDAFESEVYKEKNNISFNLTSKDIVNPNTGVKTVSLIVLIITILILIGLIITRRKKMSILVSLLLVVLIPVNVYAICKVQITMDSNITIESKPKCISFETDSWETISKNIKLNNTDCYHVGDTRTINVDNYGEQQIRLVNKSTPSVCQNPGFSQTACGYVVEFIDLLGISAMQMNYSMNQASRCDGNSCGWTKCFLRNTLNKYTINYLPEDLRNIIIDTYVVSGHSDRFVSDQVETDENQNFITTDKMYIITISEVWNDGYETDSSANYTRQLDYYANINASSTNNSSQIKNRQGNPTSWWTRSPKFDGGGSSFLAINNNGTYSNDSTMSNLAYFPVFRIG